MVRVQQLRRLAHVFFAIIENELAAVVAPSTSADVFRNRILVYAFPTFDPVGAAGVSQALARPLSHLVGIVRQQDVAGCEVGGVLVEDVCGEFPAQHREAHHFRPRAVGDEQRVVPNIERWCLVELTGRRSAGGGW